MDYVRTHVGPDLLTWVGRSGFVRDGERGDVRPIDALEPANRAALATIRAAVDGCVKDWPAYARQAAEFHRRNAAAWGNDKVGADLADQIDPGFTLGSVVPVS